MLPVNSTQKNQLLIREHGPDHRVPGGRPVREGRSGRSGCPGHGRHVLIPPCPGKTTDKARSGARDAGAGFFAVCFLLYPRCSRLARSRAGPALEMPTAFIADHIVQPLDHVPRHILRQRRPDGRPILKNNPVTADSQQLHAVFRHILHLVP